MNARHVINTICNRTDKSRRTLSAAIGRSPNFISVTIQNNSVPQVDTLAAIAEECGYHLAIVPHEHKLPKDAIVIDPAK